MWRKSVILLLVSLATSGVATRADAMLPDTIRQTKVIYDPIDYSSVNRQLQRAAQPTFWQRLTTRLRSPLFDDNPTTNFRTTGRLGVRYAPETKLSFTGVLAGEYSTAKGNSETPISTLSLTMDVSLTGYYGFYLMGDTYLPQGKDRFTYSVSTSSMPVRFWGLGYDAGRYNLRTKYVNKSTNADVRYLRELVRGLWVGGAIECNYAEGTSFDTVGEEYLAMANQNNRPFSSLGVGLTAIYDRRNVKVNTTDGVYLSLLTQMRPKQLSNIDNTLLHLEAVADYYTPVWSGGVVAVDLYANLWSLETPWIMWPSVGGSNRMRGYYYGRYTDRKMLLGQVELRQQIYGPIGCAVWGGAAKIFPSFKRFDFKNILPNYGLGVRVALGDGTSLRIDYGFGCRSNELIININEAF